MATVDIESLEFDELAGRSPFDLDAPPPARRPRRRWISALARRFEVFLRTHLVERLLAKSQLDRMYLIMGGHVYFQTLAAAVEVRLFTILARHGSLTEAELAEKLQLEPKPTRILLLGCTALGLLRKRRDRYSNSLLAGRLLDEQRFDNIVPVIRWQQLINYPAMSRFGDALRANDNVGLDVFSGEEDTLYERLIHVPRLQGVFQDAMQAISVQANRTLTRFVDFHDVATLVDIGGGNGTNAMALARAFPHLQAVVFDSPSVCAIADKHIAGAGLSQRVSTHGGNCFEDPLPEGADCYLLCHFCTIWSEDRNRQLFRKVYAALPEGGRIVVFNMMQWDSRRGPLSAALGSPYFLTLATGEGMLYTWSEYESWLRDAGFSQITRQTLPRDHGVIVGIK